VTALLARAVRLAGVSRSANIAGYNKNTRRYADEQSYAVYKLDSDQSDTTHPELTKGKTDESEEPSS